MVTEKIEQAMQRYPDLSDIVELAAHHEDRSPIRRICEYLATLTADLIDAVPERENDGEEI